MPTASFEINTGIEWSYRICFDVEQDIEFDCGLVLELNCGFTIKYKVDRD